MNSRMNFNDYQFLDNEFFNDMFINNKSNIGSNNSLSIFGTYDGYLKGNMFKNIYNQYKDYMPTKLVPNNEQAQILLNLNQASFAAHDIRLYLDIYPNDSGMINIFNSFQNQANEQLKEYEKKFGPIMMNTLSDNNMFNWESYSFPWEKEEI